jgi:CrcB protein
MKEFIAVFVGSGLGGLLRFFISKWIDSWHYNNFPWGTFVVNIIACFILGFIIGLSDHKQILTNTVRLFITVGFCGGFSTFSTFSNETLSMFQQGNYLTAFINILGSVLLCLTATFGGLLIAEKI